jgi:isopentenyl-diphosphate delta-isomerase
LAEAARRPADEVVSSDDESLILVDEADRVVGHLDKGACHDGDGVLHRAFSLFVFNRAGELLLQRRSAEKRLWPLYWSNSCCSHPRRGEAMDEATHRRLLQELEMTAELHFLYKFQYHARYESLGSENEICWVYAGLSSDHARPNDHEIAEHRWVAPPALDAEMAASAAVFTPWFQMEWHRVRGLFRAALHL